MKLLAVMLDAMAATACEALIHGGAAKCLESQLRSAKQIEVDGAAFLGASRDFRIFLVLNFSGFVEIL